MNRNSGASGLLDALNLFSTESTTVRLEPGIDIPSLLGIDLSPSQMAALAGAPKGSHVRVYYKPSWTRGELGDNEAVPGGVVLEVVNRDYIVGVNETVLYREEDGSLRLYIKLVQMKERPELKGIGGALTWSIAEVARHLHEPIQRLHLWAAGGRLWADRDANGGRWVGYVAWPRYGFDMELAEENRVLFPYFPYYPRGLSNCSRVSHLLELDGGEQFWRVNGHGDYMEFDLSPGSQSLKRLMKWADRRLMMTRGRSGKVDVSGSAKFAIGTSKRTGASSAKGKVRLFNAKAGKAARQRLAGKVGGAKGFCAELPPSLLDDEDLKP